VFATQAGVGAALTGLVTRRRAVAGRPPREFATRAVAAQSAVLPAIVAGSLVVAGNSSGFWWLAAATMLCILAGVGDAWAVLVEILR